MVTARTHIPRAVTGLQISAPPVVALPTFSGGSPHPSPHSSCRQEPTINNLPVKSLSSRTTYATLTNDDLEPDTLTSSQRLSPPQLSLPLSVSLSLFILFHSRHPLPVTRIARIHRILETKMAAESPQSTK